MDVVIKHGSVIDGTGAAPRRADVALDQGRVVAVDPDLSTHGARQVIDADGLIVTPGFVDIHTHFDGQVTWDPIVAPSSLHGVTSIVMGNCGVGFAPAHPSAAHHDWLIGLLEGVEDIPGTALAEGLAWDWETFPDYLDALERRNYTIDVAAQVAHAPLRAFVMGERGADPNEPPSADELQEMYEHTRAGIRAGAIGFTTSRTYVHRTRDGQPLGTRFSSTDELIAIAMALHDEDAGVIQMISDAYQSTDTEFAQAELDMMRDLARAVRRPLSMTVQQQLDTPDRWRDMLAFAGDCAAEGLDVKAQVAPRPIGLLAGLSASVHPFMLCAAFGEVAGLPLVERVVALRDPERRARIVAQHGDPHEGLLGQITHSFDLLFPLTDPVDYEPSPAESVAGMAAAQGVSPVEVAYDLLLRDDGNQLLYLPLFNYVARDLSDVREMLLSDHVVLGLSDAGAHCGVICDGSMPTTALSLWTHRRRGAGLPLETMVHHLTQRTARHVGWLDRGVLAPGYVADVNVIDLDALGARPPRIVHDLPAGGRRLMQHATGYRHTIKRGVVTFAEGEHTGELPGALVRGAQPAPIGG
jgi:N-acyl-D-aspartate/D-glutamate deacylase